MAKITFNEVKAFMRYIITQPVVEMKNMVIGLWHSLNQPRFWFYIMFFAVAFRILILRSWGGWGDRLILVALVIIIIWKEYTDGRWKNRWREQEKQKIIEHVRREMQENGGNNNGV